MNKRVSAVLKAVEKHGLLLENDPAVPSVISILAGEPVKGGWWTHPHGNRIHNELNETYDAGDFITIKILNGKNTLVSKDLQPAVISLLLAHEKAARKGLPKLLAEIDRDIQKRGEWDTFVDKLDPKYVKRLESKGLCFTRQFHTKAGHHAKKLESWKHLAKRLRMKAVPVEKALEQVDKAVATWKAPTDFKLKWIWKGLP